MGYVSAGKGVVVHRHNCRNWPELRKHPDRCLAMQWAPITRGMFKVALRMITKNAPGVLANITASISEAGSNIEKVEQPESNPETATLLFTISVENRDHMARVIRRLRRNQYVIKVNRLECLTIRARPSLNWNTASRIHTPDAPDAIGTYSQAMRIGDLVFLSGQIPLNPQTMELVDGDIEAQVRQVFDNLQAVCGAAGGSLDGTRQAECLPDRHG